MNISKQKMLFGIRKLSLIHLQLLRVHIVCKSNTPPTAFQPHANEADARKKFSERLI